MEATSTGRKVLMGVSAGFGVCAGFLVLLLASVGLIIVVAIFEVVARGMSLIAVAVIFGVSATIMHILGEIAIVITGDLNLVSDSLVSISFSMQQMTILFLSIWLYAVFDIKYAAAIIGIVIVIVHIVLFCIYILLRPHIELIKLPKNKHARKMKKEAEEKENEDSEEKKNGFMATVNDYTYNRRYAEDLKDSIAQSINDIHDIGLNAPKLTKDMKKVMSYVSSSVEYVPQIKFSAPLSYASWGLAVMAPAVNEITLYVFAVYWVNNVASQSDANAYLSWIMYALIGVIHGVTLLAGLLSQKELVIHMSILKCFAIPAVAMFADPRGVIVSVVVLLGFTTPVFFIQWLLSYPYIMNTIAKILELYDPIYSKIIWFGDKRLYKRGTTLRASFTLSFMFFLLSISVYYSSFTHTVFPYFSIWYLVAFAISAILGVLSIPFDAGWPYLCALALSYPYIAGYPMLYAKDWLPWSFEAVTSPISYPNASQDVLWALGFYILPFIKMPIVSLIVLVKSLVNIDTSKNMRKYAYVLSLFPAAAIIGLCIASYSETVNHGSYRAYRIVFLFIYMVFAYLIDNGLGTEPLTRVFTWRSRGMKIPVVMVIVVITNSVGMLYTNELDGDLYIYSLFLVVVLLLLNLKTWFTPNPRLVDVTLVFSVSLTVFASFIVFLAFDGYGPVGTFFSQLTDLDGPLTYREFNAIVFLVFVCLAFIATIERRYYFLDVLQPFTFLPGVGAIVSDYFQFLLVEHKTLPWGLLWGKISSITSSDVSEEAEMSEDMPPEEYAPPSPSEPAPAYNSEAAEVPPAINEGNAPPDAPEVAEEVNVELSGIRYEDIVWNEDMIYRDTDEFYLYKNRDHSVVFARSLRAPQVMLNISVAIAYLYLLGDNFRLHPLWVFAMLIPIVFGVLDGFLSPLSVFSRHSLFIHVFMFFSVFQIVRWKVLYDCLTTNSDTTTLEILFDVSLALSVIILDMFSAKLSVTAVFILVESLMDGTGIIASTSILVYLTIRATLFRNRWILIFIPPVYLLRAIPGAFFMKTFDVEGKYLLVFISVFLFAWSILVSTMQFWIFRKYDDVVNLARKIFGKFVELDDWSYENPTNLVKGILMKMISIDEKHAIFKSPSLVQNLMQKSASSSKIEDMDFYTSLKKFINYINSSRIIKTVYFIEVSVLLFLSTIGIAPGTYGWASPVALIILIFFAFVGRYWVIFTFFPMLILVSIMSIEYYFIDTIRLFGYTGKMIADLSMSEEQCLHAVPSVAATVVFGEDGRLYPVNALFYYLFELGSQGYDSFIEFLGGRTLPCFTPGIPSSLIALLIFVVFGLPSKYNFVARWITFQSPFRKRVVMEMNWMAFVLCSTCSSLLTAGIATDVAVVLSLVRLMLHRDIPYVGEMFACNPWLALLHLAIALVSYLVSTFLYLTFYAELVPGARVQFLFLYGIGMIVWSFGAFFSTRFGALSYYGYVLRPKDEDDVIYNFLHGTSDINPFSYFTARALKRLRFWAYNMSASFDELRAKVLNVDVKDYKLDNYTSTLNKFYRIWDLYVHKFTIALTSTAATVVFAIGCITFANITLGIFPLVVVPVTAAVLFLLGFPHFVIVVPITIFISVTISLEYLESLYHYDFLATAPSRMACAAFFASLVAILIYLISFVFIFYEKFAFRFYKYILRPNRCKRRTLMFYKNLNSALIFSVGIGVLAGELDYGIMPVIAALVIVVKIHFEQWLFFSLFSPLFFTILGFSPLFARINFDIFRGLASILMIVSFFWILLSRTRGYHNFFWDTSEQRRYLPKLLFTYVDEVYVGLRIVEEDAERIEAAAKEKESDSSNDSADDSSSGDSEGETAVSTAMPAVEVSPAVDAGKDDAGTDDAPDTSEASSDSEYKDAKPTPPGKADEPEAKKEEATNSLFTKGFNPLSVFKQYWHITTYAIILDVFCYAYVIAGGVYFCYSPLIFFQTAQPFFFYALLLLSVIDIFFGFLRNVAAYRLLGAFWVYLNMAVLLVPVETNEFERYRLSSWVMHKLIAFLLSFCVVLVSTCAYFATVLSMVFSVARLKSLQFITRIIDDLVEDSGPEAQFAEFKSYLSFVSTWVTEKVGDGATFLKNGELELHREMKILFVQNFVNPLPSPKEEDFEEEERDISLELQEFSLMYYIRRFGKLKRPIILPFELVIPVGLGILSIVLCVDFVYVLYSFISAGMVFNVSSEEYDYIPAVLSSLFFLGSALTITSSTLYILKYGKMKGYIDFIQGLSFFGLTASFTLIFWYLGGVVESKTSGIIIGVYVHLFLETILVLFCIVVVTILSVYMKIIHKWDKFTEGISSAIMEQKHENTILYVIDMARRILRKLTFDEFKFTFGLLSVGLTLTSIFSMTFLYHFMNDGVFTIHHMVVGGLLFMEAIFIAYLSNNGVFTLLVTGTIGIWVTVVRYVYWYTVQYDQTVFTGTIAWPDFVEGGIDTIQVHIYASLVFVGLLTHVLHFILSPSAIDGASIGVFFSAGLYQVVAALCSWQFSLYGVITSQYLGAIYLFTSMVLFLMPTFLYWTPTYPVYCGFIVGSLTGNAKYFASPLATILVYFFIVRLWFSTYDTEFAETETDDAKEDESSEKEAEVEYRDIDGESNVESHDVQNVPAEREEASATDDEPKIQEMYGAKVEKEEAVEPDEVSDEDISTKEQFMKWKENFVLWKFSTWPKYVKPKFYHRPVSAEMNTYLRRIRILAILGFSVSFVYSDWIPVYVKSVEPISGFLNANILTFVLLLYNFSQQVFVFKMIFKLVFKLGSVFLRDTKRLKIPKILQRTMMNTLRWDNLAVPMICTAASATALVNPNLLFPLTYVISYVVVAAFTTVYVTLRRSLPNRNATLINAAVIHSSALLGGIILAAGNRLRFVSELAGVDMEVLEVFFFAALLYATSQLLWVDTVDLSIIRYLPQLFTKNAVDTTKLTLRKFGRCGRPAYILTMVMCGVGIMSLDQGKLRHSVVGFLWLFVALFPLLITTLELIFSRRELLLYSYTFAIVTVALTVVLPVKLAVAMSFGEFYTRGIRLPENAFGVWYTSSTFDSFDPLNLSIPESVVSAALPVFMMSDFIYFLAIIVFDIPLMTLLLVNPGGKRRKRYILELIPVVYGILILMDSGSLVAVFLVSIYVTIRGVVFNTIVSVSLVPVFILINMAMNYGFNVYRIDELQFLGIYGIALFIWVTIVYVAPIWRRFDFNIAYKDESEAIMGAEVDSKRMEVEKEKAAKELSGEGIEVDSVEEDVADAEYRAMEELELPEKEGDGWKERIISMTHAVMAETAFASFWVNPDTIRDEAQYRIKDVRKYPLKYALPLVTAPGGDHFAYQVVLRLFTVERVAIALLCPWISIMLFNGILTIAMMAVTVIAVILLSQSPLYIAFFPPSLFLGIYFALRGIDYQRFREPSTILQTIGYAAYVPCLLSLLLFVVLNSPPRKLRTFASILAARNVKYIPGTLQILTNWEDILFTKRRNLMKSTGSRLVVESLGVWAAIFSLLICDVDYTFASLFTFVVLVGINAMGGPYSPLSLVRYIELMIYGTLLWLAITAWQTYEPIHPFLFKHIPTCDNYLCPYLGLAGILYLILGISSFSFLDYVRGFTYVKLWLSEIIFFFNSGENARPESKRFEDEMEKITLDWEKDLEDAADRGTSKGFISLSRRKMAHLSPSSSCECVELCMTYSSDVWETRRVLSMLFPSSYRKSASPFVPYDSDELERPRLRGTFRVPKALLTFLVMSFFPMLIKSLASPLFVGAALTHQLTYGILPALVFAAYLVYMLLSYTSVTYFFGLVYGFVIVFLQSDSGFDIYILVGIYITLFGYVGLGGIVSRRLRFGTMNYFSFIAACVFTFLGVAIGPLVLPGQLRSTADPFTWADILMFAPFVFYTVSYVVYFVMGGYQYVIFMPPLTALASFRLLFRFSDVDHWYIPVQNAAMVGSGMGVLLYALHHIPRLGNFGLKRMSKEGYRSQVRFVREVLFVESVFIGVWALQPTFGFYPMALAAFVGVRAWYHQWRPLIGFLPLLMALPLTFSVYPFQPIAFAGMLIVLSLIMLVLRFTSILHNWFWEKPTIYGFERDESARDIGDRLSDWITSKNIETLLAINWPPTRFWNLEYEILAECFVLLSLFVIDFYFGMIFIAPVMSLVIGAFNAILVICTFYGLAHNFFALFFYTMTIILFAIEFIYVAIVQMNYWWTILGVILSAFTFILVAVSIVLFFYSALFMMRPQKKKKEKMGGKVDDGSGAPEEPAEQSFAPSYAAQAAPGQQMYAAQPANVPIQYNVPVAPMVAPMGGPQVMQPPQQTALQGQGQPPPPQGQFIVMQPGQQLPPGAIVYQVPQAPPAQLAPPPAPMDAPQDILPQEEGQWNPPPVAAVDL